MVTTGISLTLRYTIATRPPWFLIVAVPTWLAIQFGFFLLTPGCCSSFRSPGAIWPPVPPAAPGQWPRSAPSRPLYDLMTQAPGLTLVPHTVDGLRRAGVGIAWLGPGGGKTMIIFNPLTYAELGLTAWGAGM
jgi:hypothetical protein